MKMLFSLEPLYINITNRYDFGISILGYAWNNTHRALGFHVYTKKYPDRFEIKINLHVFNYIRKRVIKSVKCSHYVCNTCGNPVWRKSLYCSTCGEDMTKFEVSWVDINKIS